MKSKAPPWWQLPSIIVASLGALGTATVVIARYVTLPTRVEAGEQKNVQQDKQIDRLITLQEYYQQQQQVPNLPAPRTPRWEWRQDEEGNWYCYGERESWWPNERGECE